MNSTELIRCMANDPHIRSTAFGVFPRNRIPRCEEPGLYIINTDSLGGPGKHWLLIYAAEDCTRYVFDSLALDREYANVVMNSVGGRCILVTKWVMQNDLSQMCGAYALYFARMLARLPGQHLWDTIFTPFSPYLPNQNDMYVQEYLWENVAYFLPLGISEATT